MSTRSPSIVEDRSAFGGRLIVALSFIRAHDTIYVYYLQTKLIERHSRYFLRCLGWSAFEVLGIQSPGCTCTVQVPICVSMQRIISSDLISDNDFAIVSQRQRHEWSALPQINFPLHDSRTSSLLVWLSNSNKIESTSIPPVFHFQCNVSQLSKGTSGKNSLFDILSTLFS